MDMPTILVILAARLEGLTRLFGLSKRLDLLLRQASHAIPFLFCCLFTSMGAVDHALPDCGASLGWAIIKEETDAGSDIEAN